MNFNKSKKMKTNLNKVGESAKNIVTTIGTKTKDVVTNTKKRLIIQWM